MVPEARHRFATADRSGDLLDIHAINHDFAFLHLVEATNQINRGALACSALAHEANHLARRNSKTDVLQHRLVRLIAERDIFEFHASFDARQRNGLLGVPHIGFGIEDFENPFRGSEERERKSATRLMNCKGP